MSWWRWFFPLTITYPYEFKYPLSSIVDETEENKIKHMLSSGLNNLNFKIIAKKQLNQFTTLIQVDI